MNGQLELFGTTGLCDHCILQLDGEGVEAALKDALRVLRKRGYSKEQRDTFKELVWRERVNSQALAAAEQRANKRPSFAPSSEVWVCNPLKFTQTTYGQVLDPNNKHHVDQWGRECVNDFVKMGSEEAVPVFVFGTTDTRYHDPTRFGEPMRLGVIYKCGLLATKIVFGTP